MLQNIEDMGGGRMEDKESPGGCKYHTHMKPALLWPYPGTIRVLTV